MPDKAERAGSDHAQTRRVHHLHVPVIAQGADDPPTDGVRSQKNCEHRRGEKRDEGPLEQNDLQRGAHQDGGVQEHHPTKARFIDFGRAARDKLLLMAARNAQLEQAQRRDSREQQEKSDYTQVHWRSKNSALKPGPKAAASAYSPGFKGRFSSHSWRIKRMVALERLPTFPRISQEGWVWHFVKPRAISTLPISRAPPGCRIQPLMSFWVLPLRWRKSSTSSRIFAPIISGTSLASRM